MPEPDGYLLSQKDAKLFRELAYKFLRQQHYVNAFGRPPDNKIDNEEMHTSEIHIARSPEGGIPALEALSSDGIGHIPGKAVCTIFKTSQSADLTEDVTDFKETIYNLSTTAIPEETWLVVVKDKYGKHYGFPIPSVAGGGGTSVGPGWTAGLSNEDCLLLTVTEAVGKCATIPSQEILLISDVGIVWEGLDDFVYSGGVGAVQFTRLDNHSLPTLTIGPYTLIWNAAGIDDAGNYWIEYKGGTDLCSDVSGTGTGTGGARAGCGSNTFTVRLTCSDCSYIEAVCCPDDLLPDRLYAEYYGGTLDFAILNGTVLELDYKGIHGAGLASYHYWVSECLLLPGALQEVKYYARCRLSGEGWDYIGPLQTEIGPNPCTSSSPFEYWTTSATGYASVDCTPNGGPIYDQQMDTVFPPSNHSGWTGTVNVRVTRNHP